MRIKGNYSHCLNKVVAASRSKAGAKVPPKSGPQPKASSPAFPVEHGERGLLILRLVPNHSRWV